METITVNGKEYVSKDEYLNEIQDLKGKSENLISGHILMANKMVLDERSIMGLGNAKLSKDWSFITVDIIFLERAIKTLKSFDPGRQNITLGITKDNPLCIGRLDEEKKEFNGIFIAPRIESV